MKAKEHDIQANIVQYLRIKGIPTIGTDVMSGLTFFSHKDNRRFSFIAHHKNIGYTKGQPDLVILTPNRAICLEVKADKGYQSPEQKYFQEECERMSIDYYLVRSLDDVINILKDIDY